jgi:ABC-type thiamine transport system ATPase subunit
MDSDSCITKVTHALKDVKDIRTRYVGLGKAKIEADQHGCDAACKAVSAIGFNAHEIKDDKKNAQRSLTLEKGVNKETPASQAAAKAAPKKR